MEWKIPATSRNNLMEVLKCIKSALKSAVFYGYNCNRTSYLLGRLDRPFPCHEIKQPLTSLIAVAARTLHTSPSSPSYLLHPFTLHEWCSSATFEPPGSPWFTTHRGLKHHTFCWPSDPGGSPPSGDMAKVKPGIGASMKGSWISGGVMDWARRAEILGDLRADRMQSMIFLKIRCGKYL